jgi:hypothetical protein
MAAEAAAARLHGCFYGFHRRRAVLFQGSRNGQGGSRLQLPSMQCVLLSSLSSAEIVNTHLRPLTEKLPNWLPDCACRIALENGKKSVQSVPVGK